MRWLPLARVINHTPMVAGLLVTALSLLVLFGWHSENTALTQLHPALPPMSFGVAVTFLMLGFGLLAATLGSWHLTLLCGASAFALGMITLADLVLGTGLGLDLPFSADGMLVPQLALPQVQPNVAGLEALTGLVLMLAAQGLRDPHDNALLPSVLALLVSVLSLIALLVQLSSINADTAWRQLLVMPAHTALGFGLLGFALSIFRWPSESREPVTVQRLQGLVITYVTAGVFVTMLFSSAISLLPLYELVILLRENKILRTLDSQLSSVLERQMALTAVGTLLLAYLGGFGVWRLLRPLAGRVLLRADELEKAIQKATRELEASVDNLKHSNRELEEFAYIASHDLKAPLRGILGFSQLLERDYAGKLDTNGREYLDFIGSEAKKMQDLVDALLQLSRLNSRKEPLAPVDMGEVIHEAKEHLRGVIEESSAAITHDPLPRVMADRQQLVQVMQNLLANGIKFQPKERRPEVHITASREGEFWRLSIRDNGIGIAPENVPRLFTIFTRLHSQDEFPGTGIGLALCKRVMERHGGRIWVESIPGQGSTFHFTLPGGE